MEVTVLGQNQPFCSVADVILHKNMELHYMQARSKTILCSTMLKLLVCHVQLKDDTARVEEEEAEKKVKLKAMREHHHKWEDTREGRVGTWRDFVKGKKTRVCTALLEADNH